MRIPSSQGGRGLRALHTIEPLYLFMITKGSGGMRMAVQKLSKKNQIVIPKQARQAMGVKGGDELLVVVRNDPTLVMPKPKRYARTLKGLAKGAYPPGYLKRERRSW
jgi:AbrB family looped-hinge helix DNA binding protein